MVLRAVIFDVDGTLAETEEAHRHAFNDAFARAGFDWHWDRARYAALLKVAGGRERIRHFLAADAPDALDLLGEDGIARLHQDKTRLYQERLASGRVPLRPGVARLIREVRDHPDLRLAIATTTHSGNVAALLVPALGADAPGWFDAIAAAEQAAAKKPAPDVYLWVLDRLGLAAHECLAIEDSRNGLLSATAAGIATLITVDPYTEGQDFTGAVAVLSDLGKPDRPMRTIAGKPPGRDFVDVSLIDQLVASSGRKP